MLKVTVFEALGDNYIYLCEYAKGRVLAVDPCDAAVVLRALQQNRLELTDILVTHHHWDHTGGVEQLKGETGATVYCGDGQRVGGVDRVVHDADSPGFGDVEGKVIATPGHTRTSVCYYLRDRDGRGGVFTGDTLFAGGCGRLLECDAGTMWASLQKLVGLPDETQVYCGHDYTQENCDFALGLVPGDAEFGRRAEEIGQLCREGKVTVPSSIGREKACNIFLRAGDDVVRQAMKMGSARAEEVFAELRWRKDRF
jgi:hydroxyacylglutathione hydrolase